MNKAIVLMAALKYKDKKIKSILFNIISKEKKAVCVYDTQYEVILCMEK